MQAHCTYCCRPMVARKGDARKPGEMGMYSKGVCSACGTRRRRGIPLPGHDYDCRVCGEWVDTSPNPVGASPGRGGVCAICARVLAKSPWEGTPCKTCGRVFVLMMDPLAPGEAHHFARGECHACYMAGVRAVKSGRVEEIEVKVVDKAVARPGVDENRAALAAFMRRRKSRVMA